MSAAANCLMRDQREPAPSQAATCDGVFNTKHSVPLHLTQIEITH
jgi:hypothetical protein